MQTIKKNISTIIKLAVVAAYVGVAIFCMTSGRVGFTGTAEAQTTNFSQVNAAPVYPTNYVYTINNGPFVLNTNAPIGGGFLDIIPVNTVNAYYTSNALTSNQYLGNLSYYVAAPKSLNVAFSVSYTLTNQGALMVGDSNTLNVIIDEGTGQGDWISLPAFSCPSVSTNTNTWFNGPGQTQIVGTAGTNFSTGGFTCFRVHSIGWTTNAGWTADGGTMALTNPCMITTASFSSKSGL